MSDAIPESDLSRLIGGDPCPECGWELERISPDPRSTTRFETFLTCDHCHSKWTPEGKDITS